MAVVRVCALTRSVDKSVNVTFSATEVRGRRSAMPEGDGNVEMSTTRKRSRVMSAPVLFVNVRRIAMVPKVELFGGSLTKLRSTLGESKSACAGSSRALPMAVPALVGAETDFPVRERRDVDRRPRWCRSCQRKESRYCYRHCRPASPRRSRQYGTLRTKL